MTITVRAIDRATDRRAIEAIDTSRSRRTARGRRDSVWLETSNVNVPGVAAYERLGYTLCGADRLFYGPYMRGETAIYLAKMLRTSAVSGDGADSSWMR